MKELVGCLGLIVLGLLLGLGAPLYMAFANGFVLSKLWLWYAVPFGLPIIGWKPLGMLGAALYVIRPNATTFGTGGSKTEKQGAAIGLLLAPWFALLIGWILL